MGLDTVELVLAIEEEFGIEIPDAVAPKLGVLGEMNDYIVSALRQKGEAPDAEQIWKRLVAIVVRQLGVSPEMVTRAADVVRDLKAD